MVSAYPFDRLPALTRAQAALESALAQHVAARPRGHRLTALAGSIASGGSLAPASGASASAAVRVTAIRAVGAVDATVVERARRGPSAPLPADAACCELRIAGRVLDVRGSNRGVRALAQRLLGGPPELDAPRPLTIVEERVWAHVVSLAVDDLGIAGEVIAVDGPRRFAPGRDSREPRARRPVVSIDLVLGDIPLAVELAIDARGAFELASPPPRAAGAWPSWVDAREGAIDVPIVVGRCALPRDAVGRLAVRDIVTIEGALELEIFGGAVGLRAAPGAVSAAVASGYVRRDMSLPDDASVELTIALGTTQMTIRQVLELAVGQIVQLGRPLAGPFELRALGRVVGRGELVDVDGELGVRIVSLES
ncbi:MAG: FliM/FliN family flagellar motor switch protein [Deltaproteobacteria bacterium]|nr:FliM/FliN family flagellar motor switch protein [Deltaproteobacteria bacterium]